MFAQNKKALILILIHKNIAISNSGTKEKNVMFPLLSAFAIYSLSPASFQVINRVWLYIKNPELNAPDPKIEDFEIIIPASVAV